jgi:chromosome segregation ATPase
VRERAEKVANERATVEASLGRLRAEEQGLLAELSALHAERDERNRELAEAREHLASLDATLAGEELTGIARAQDLEFARHRLERDRELASRLEQEILDVRRQVSTAQERLRGLVQNVLRIQHKLWRAAHRSGDSPLAGG